MSSSRLEITILRNLVHNEEYMRKVLPFVKSEYFTDESERTIYKIISEFVVWFMYVKKQLLKNAKVQSE